MQPLISFETSNLALNQLEIEITLPQALTDVIEPLDDAEQNEILQISTKFMESKGVTERNSTNRFVFIRIICAENRALRNYG